MALNGLICSPRGRDDAATGAKPSHIRAGVEGAILYVSPLGPVVGEETVIGEPGLAPPRRMMTNGRLARRSGWEGRPHDDEGFSESGQGVGRMDGYA
jgi:hypothetical protein